jgi:hypothetical protein
MTNLGGPVERRVEGSCAEGEGEAVDYVLLVLWEIKSARGKGRSEGRARSRTSSPQNLHLMSRHTLTPDSRTYTSGPRTIIPTSAASLVCMTSKEVRER